MASCASQLASRRGKYTEQAKTESEDACQFTATQTIVSFDDARSRQRPSRIRPASCMQIRLYEEGEMED